MAVVQVSNLAVNEIFPSTKTKTINKLITENSLTRLINRLLDVDGYVITSEFSDDFVEEQILKNENDYIKITENELDRDCEFSIRGYYFNIGTYREILNNSAYRNSGLLTPPVGEELSVMASIYISNDTEYPELYGQDIYITEQVFKDTASSDDEIVLSDTATASTVSPKSIKFYYQGNEVDITASGVTDEHIILDSNGNLIVWGSNVIDKVKYVIASSNSALYLSNDVTETETEANYNYSLPDIQHYTRYNLELFKVFIENDTPVIAIPISSLHRFNTVAIATIDGGVIIEEENNQ